MLQQPDDPGDHWEDWPEGDKPDVMSWVILAAGIISIVLLASFYAFGTDFPDFKHFSER